MSNPKKNNKTNPLILSPPSLSLALSLSLVARSRSLFLEETGSDPAHVDDVDGWINLLIP